MPRVRAVPSQGRELGLALAVSLALGYVAARSAGSSQSYAALLAGFALAAVLAFTFGLRRFLLIVAIFGIPFQADKNYFYDYDASAHGALGGISLSITTLALIGLYAMWASELLLDSRQAVRPKLQWAVPGIAYLSAAAVSLVAAQSVALGWNELMLIAQSILLFVYVSSTVRSVVELRWITRVLILAMVFQAALMILQYFTGLNFHYAGLQSSERIEEATRTSGTIGSPNTAASFLAPCIAVAVALLVARRVTSRSLPALGVGVGSLALVFTYSRGGWLACAIAVAFVVTVLGLRHQLTSRILIVGAILFVVGLSLGQQIQARLESKAGGASARVALAEVSFDVIRDHPLLGVGSNNYVSVLGDYASLDIYSYVPHNKFLLVWAETGLVGLIAFVFFLLASLRRGWLALRASTTQLLPYVVALNAAFLALLVHMNFEPFHGRPQVMLLFTVAGLLYAAAAIAKTGSAESVESEPRSRDRLGRAAGPTPFTRGTGEAEASGGALSCAC